MVLVVFYLESMKDQDTHLVITPASLLLNWQDEIEKFSASLRVLCIYGQKAHRDELIEKLDQYDVVITSYDYLRRDIMKIKIYILLFLMKHNISKILKHAMRYVSKD